MLLFFLFCFPLTHPALHPLPSPSKAKRFLDRFHERQKEKLVGLLGNERWVPADVPSECQRLVNNLCRDHGLEAHEISASGENAKRLYLGPHAVAVPGAMLMFAKIIAEYCRCAQEMAVLAPDLLNRLVDVLRTFNKQTYRLILKAGARETVGLRTITAKHLALASQALSAVQYLIPCLRSRFQTLLSEQQQILLDDFDVVASDLSSHRQDIFAKIVSIMDDGKGGGVCCLLIRHHYF